MNFYKCLSFALLLCPSGTAVAFHHRHAEWDALLKRYLETLSAVTEREYADRLAESETERQRIRAGEYRIEFLDYDWRLNDAH